MPSLNEQQFDLTGEYRLDEGEASGSAKVHPLAEGYYVSNVRASPKGRGHGTRLVQQIADDADQAGAPLYLHATAAKGFWEKQGFAQVENPSPQIQGPFEGVPVLRRDPRTAPDA